MNIKNVTEPRDYKEAAVIEAAELKIKIIRLEGFIERNPNYNQIHLLSDQLDYMRKYHNTLVVRISRF